MAKAGPRGVLLGFLAIRKTPSEGVRGGYLITTEYGRPVEFHYTTELKLAGPQRLLFGGAAPEYLHVELIAVPLTDKQTVAPQILFVDSGYTTVWGNGIIGSVFSGSIPVGDSSRTHTAYGKVPAGQNTLKAGSFSDWLTMTITYNP